MTSNFYYTTFINLILIQVDIKYLFKDIQKIEQ